MKCPFNKGYMGYLDDKDKNSFVVDYCTHQKDKPEYQVCHLCLLSKLIDAIKKDEET